MLPSAEDFEELQAKIREHHAKNVYWRWKKLQLIGVVLTANGAELKAYIKRVEDETDFKPIGSPEAEVFFGQVLRMTLNYVAASGTLIDHTRNVLKKYEGKSFLQEYEARKSAMIGLPAVELMKALRNFMLHADAPGFAQRLRATPTEAHLTILLCSDELVESSACSARLKAYLREVGDIPLVQAVEDHELQVHGLYSWLFEQFHELHGAEIAEFNELIARRDAFYAQAGILPTPSESASD